LCLIVLTSVPSRAKILIVVGPSVGR
jgi:hypothetical protein